MFLRLIYALSGLVRLGGSETERKCDSSFKDGRNLRIMLSL